MHAPISNSAWLERIVTEHVLSKSTGTEVQIRKKCGVGGKENKN